MTNPYVSVIIPNYCHSKYLDQRIHSVLNQTYQNFELIILDDCSPDNGASKAVIEQYRSNPHVSHIVYNETNSGSTFKQWNRGFELATGELIWIAESDDYCDSAFLESAVSAYCNHENVSVVFCTSQLVDEIGNIIPPIYNKQIDENRFYTGSDFIKRRMFRCNAIVNASSAIFSKDVVLKIDKNYMNYVAAGDYLFWVHLAEMGNVIHLTPPHNYFRQHRNKVSPRKLIDGTVTREVFRIISYLKDKGYISRIQSLIIDMFYVNQTQTLDFESEKLKSELMQLWNRDNKITASVARYFVYLYFRLRLYKIWE